MGRALFGMAAALALAACQAPVRPASPATNPGGAPAGAPSARSILPPPVSGSVDALAAAIDADARQSDHESDSKRRADLADDAARNADACLAEAPQAAACLYYHGVALGLAARAHPARAVESLKSMLESLTRAEAVDPEYDEAGPARVRALVLTRAPGWPLGPGDADAGVAAARRAVTLRPQYPPNVLALAEALSKHGDADEARVNYLRARDLAQALPAGTDRDDWLHDVDRALHKENGSP